MEFDLSRVYESANANEAKIGSKGFFANSFDVLERLISDYSAGEPYERLKSVVPNNTAAFSTDFLFTNFNGTKWKLFYSIEESVIPNEVTADKWDKKPRVMKVWDEDYDRATEAEVVHIFPKVFPHENSPVLTVKGNDVFFFRHCAEIVATRKIKAKTIENCRPYKDAVEFINDYKKRFCIDCLGIPAIWVKNAAGTLKQVVAITDNDVRLANESNTVDYITILNAYTYPDGSPAGALDSDESSPLQEETE